MTDEPAEPVVAYGVKELLQDIRDSVRGLDQKLDTKADKGDVVQLFTRLEGVEAEVLTLKAKDDDRGKQRTASSGRRSWQIPMTVTAGLLFFQPLWLAVLRHLGVH